MSTIAETPAVLADAWAADLVITVPRIGLTDLLTPAPVGHRHVWAYDPKLYPDLVAGRYVRFENNGEVFARGLVTEVFSPDAAAVREFCSGINSKAFRWKEVK